MAIDSRAKRESSVQVFGPHLGRVPGPTGTVDRQWMLWMYTGIAAATPAAVVSIGDLILEVDSTQTLIINVQSTQTLAINVDSTKELIFNIES